ncbi:MAG TPA: alpha-ketoglutarate-dependent dioxygenase AlkB, partial [Acidimicrobiales bacterium]|nr:alpha-ketoglutarate-dependent dioxygenase AlkB [Acidimicrobiales bacterium]
VGMGEQQLDLFGVGAPAVDATFGGARRQRLDEGSWVEVVPHWLTGGEQVLASMRTSVPWEQRQRWMYDQLFDEPRLTAEYPDLADVPVAILREAGRVLSDHYGVPYDGLWLNLYRDQRDSTGWHGDWPSCRRDECIVPVLTLGARRRFLLKARAGGPSVVLSPSSGDLVVMGGRCQRDWRHCVPKQSRPAGLRVSVNFQSAWQAQAPAG